MDKLKDEFLANTSHELRTPLHGIIGIAETLRDGVIGEISSPMKNQLTMIISSGKRLSALINDILDLSKLKNDEIKLKLASVNLPELIDVVLTICQPLVRDKPVELINQVASDIPRVHADENRVQQILYNLVGNAIKHTSRGTIIVSATVAAGRVDITVTDTGKGIPEQELDSIFDPFHQVDPSSTRGASGAGIGLSITKKLVELHQGEIRVYSAVGQGTSFSFTLPISDESIRATEEAAITVETRSSLWVDEVSMMTPATRDAKKRNVRVLIAGDEPVNLQVLTNQLVLEGFDVVAVGDGQAVIEHVQHHPVDILILDIMMPKMSGYEICKRLRTQYSLTDLPILMLTAKNQVRDIVTAFEVGANDYLTKPCDREELLARVDTLVHLRRLNLELVEMNRLLEQKVLERTQALEEANLSLTKANQELTHLTETRRRLLANISHELGSPITLIQGYVQAVEQGLITADDDRYLSMVSQRVRMLDRLTADLFDLSKLESRKARLDYIEMDVVDWLMSINEQSEAHVTQERRKFRSFRSEQLHPLRPYRCQVDVDRMHQVFSNLIHNAVNYTEDDIGEISLDIEFSPVREELIVEVKDNGCGIPEDELPYLFERFYRVESSAAMRDVGGTGLGLAIVKEIVEHHGGDVQVESTLDVGTVFRIVLPVRKGDDHDEETDLNRGG